MVPKRKRPLRLSGGGLGEPTAKEAPSPQRRGPRCPKAKEAPSPQRMGPGGPKAKEAPSPRRRGPRLAEEKEAPSPQQRVPRWSQSEGGPLASAAGASVVPKPKRPPRLSGGGLDGL